MMMRAIALLQGALLVGCAGARQATVQPSLLEGPNALSRQVPAPSASGETSGLLFWGAIGDDIKKIRLSDDRDFEKKSFGLGGLNALATDRKGHVHEAAFDGQNIDMLELGNNLKAIRAFEVANSVPDSLTIGGDGEQYLSLFNGTATVIDVFEADASGEPAPKRAISGKKTKLICPEAEVIDASNYLYVANWNAFCAEKNKDNILVFAPRAKGNRAPVRILAGDQTGITGPVNLALGADGNIYVANELTGGSSPTFDILVFPTSANGNVAPIRTLQTGSYGGTIALGANGEMYVGLGPGINVVGGDLSSQGRIAVYAPGASGNDAPIGYVGKDMDADAYRIALQHPWYVP